MNPRLLVLGRDLPDNVRGQLGKYLSQPVDIAIEGVGAAPFSADSLLQRAVLGGYTDQDRLMTGIRVGCDLYVGVRTDPGLFLGKSTLDNRFDLYQFGERGFDLATKKGLHAILLDRFDPELCAAFVNLRLANTPKSADHPADKPPYL